MEHIVWMKFVWIFLIFQIIHSTYAACDGPKDSCPTNLPKACSCFNTSTGVNITCIGYKTSEILKSVPTHLPSNLYSIQIEGHDLTELTEDNFKQCYYLEVIYLRHNIIRKVAKLTFQDVPKLRWLCLNINQVNFNDSESFPQGCLDSLTNLEELWIDFNSWGDAKEYRFDIWRNKNKLRLLAMDLIHDVPLPVLPQPVSLSNLNALKFYQGIGIFRNNTLTNWQELNISYISIHTWYAETQMTWIEDNSFSMFKNLQVLDLSRNPSLVNNSQWESLFGAFVGLNKTKIHTLYLGAIMQMTMSTVNLKREVLKHLQWLNPTLTVLYLDWNGLTGIDGDIGDYLPQLKYLSLSYNRFFTYLYKNILTELYKLQNLEYIKLNRQTRWTIPPHSNLEGIHHMQKVDRNSGKDFMVWFPPKLKEIHLLDAIDGGDNVDIGSLIIVDGPDHYDIQDFSQNRFNSIKGPVRFSINVPHSIRILNLSQCALKKLDHGFFNSNLTIDTLDLSYNIGIGDEITNDNDGRFFKHMELSKVKHINLTLCDIKYVTPNLFVHSRSLEEIIIQNNAIGSWHSSIKHLVNLTKLDISDNKYLYLLKDNWEELDIIAERNPSFQLDISRNPLQISCSTLEFLQWINNPKVKLMNRDFVHFFSTDGKEDVIYHLSNLTTIIPHMEVRCSSRTWVIISGTMLGTLFVLLFISLILYRQRWDIRYFCLRHIRQRKFYQQLKEIESYRYDAFVAYHQKNLQWITDELIPNVEKHQTNHLKLCVHHRDWLPGPSIEENISASVETSRKTLIILSRHFLRSSWCEFEMQMARIRSFDNGQDVIVVIALEDIPIREMSTTLVNLRRTNTWLEWPADNHEDKITFWNQLRRAISTTSQSAVQCVCGNAVYPDGERRVVN